MLEQALRATIERILNQALAHDESSLQRLKPLQGKVAYITVSELPMPIVLMFAESEVLLMGAEFEGVDAQVSFSIFDAPTLADAASATAAIQAGKIKVVGDPILLQQAADVFTKLDIDWEELLASIVGDIPAYILAKKLKELHKPGRVASMQHRVQELLIDELELAASKVQFEQFKSEVRELHQKLGLLERQLNSVK